VRNLEGEPFVGPRYSFEPALPKAKIRQFSWHCLRHTFGSQLVMAGVDLRTVQELMGHKSIEMTVRYSHLAPKHTLAAVERLIAAEDVSNAANTNETNALEAPKTLTVQYSVEFHLIVYIKSVRLPARLS